jgi:hypothetical protein
MTDKIQIKELPITDEFIQQKRIIDERGELALIEDANPFHHLGYFSLKQGRAHPFPQ